MNDPREFTADLITGRRTRIGDRAPRSPGPAADAVLRDVGAMLDELEAELARDPAAALAHLQGLLSDPSLKAADLRSFIDVWRTAATQPDEFARRVETTPVAQRGVADWWARLRAYLHRPEQASADEQTILDGMRARYRFPDPPAPPVEPHERRFENPDPSWVPLLRVKLGEKRWPDGLAEMPRHQPPATWVYPALDAAGAPLAPDQAHTIALFADFGTGYYHSWGIAQQLAAWARPYSFHLGDVYYAGRPDEFADRFRTPLESVVGRTRLFGFAENHELYSRGDTYLAYFGDLHRRGLTPQEGSYFCVRFPHHQIIGIDVNWQGRRRYTDDGLRAWLADRLAEADGRTNILLSGNAPFDHGDTEPRPLLEDLWDFLEPGAIGLWFWGDDHYCALYDRRPPAVPFYGTCIGHGGFPGPRQPVAKATFQTEPLWLEDQPRFPEWTHLRDDVTNNGWCDVTLRPDGGVDLVYVDWLWCERARVAFDRDGAGLRVRSVVPIERDDRPRIHTPPPGA